MFAWIVDGGERPQPSGAAAVFADVRIPAALTIGTALAAVAVPVAAGQDAPPPDPAPEPRDAAIDIQIAVDTTGSMGPSIEQARRDAREIVEDTRRRLPGARFAIVDFKDQGDDPEYLVRQRMTGNANLVVKAIRELGADGGGDLPEAYNLVFARAVDDPEIGYRPGSRRMLFVIGDAEPHGAGNAELPGCSDETPDPNGLRTNEVLSLLRRARITSHFILQASSASTTLRCYRSLAGLTYGRGEALVSRSRRRGGRQSRGLAELIERAIAEGLPTVDAQPLATRPGAATRATLAIANRVPEDVRLASVQVRLPEGWSYRPGTTRGIVSSDPSSEDGRALGWTVDATVPAQRRRGFSFGLRAPREAGEEDAPVVATFVMPDGGLLRARSTIELEVVGDREDEDEPEERR
jgi:Mg-chelatase subunit ChlD